MMTGTRQQSFLKKGRFDGFELYPVGDYPFHTIPAHLIEGIHLRFFVFIREMWRQDEKGLLQLFDNWFNVEHFYGARSPEVIVDTYARQLDLAQQLGCDYVVFHPVHCDMRHVYDWQFPYDWRESLDICSEILNASLKKSSFNGWLLFENLWWPGSFRLEEIAEYDYLREHVNYQRCGIVLDTAHMIAAGAYRKVHCSTEEEAINLLLDKVKKLGGLKSEIRTVHLTSNLSAGYIKSSMAAAAQTHKEIEELDFWQRLQHARRHVSRIDPHLAFSSPEIGRLFDLVEPENTVFEFTFKGMDEWQQKIAIQKSALQNRLWNRNQ